MRLSILCSMVLGLSSWVATAAADEVSVVENPQAVVDLKDLTASGPAPSERLSPDFEALKQSKWVVRAVERDGEQAPAQTGQQIGDVIEFKHTNEGLTFG